MIIIRKPLYSNTIYKHHPLKNIGGDNQLSLQCYEGKLTRLLIGPIQYQQNIVDLLHSDDPTFQFTINLQLTVSRELLTKKNPLLDIYCIDGEWESGDNIYNSMTFAHIDGSSWKRRSTNQNWSNPGGDFLQETKKPVILSDLGSQIKLIAENISADQFSKYGFLIKCSDQNDVSKQYGRMSIYSANTKSPHYPKYKFYVNDYLYDNTNMEIITNFDLFYINILNLKQFYHIQQIVDFKVRFTPREYARDWETNYWTRNQINYAFPEDYRITYAIYDVTQIKKFQIIQHCDQTRLSTSNENNHFKLDMGSFMKNRKYQFQFKINNRIYRVKETFKIV